MTSKLYIGKKVKEKQLVQAKSRVINPDEELICVIRGGYAMRKGKGLRYDGKEGTGIPKKGLLFITNQRVIFYIKGSFGGYEQVIFPYKQINSISHGKGFWGEGIIIEAISDSIGISGLKKEDGKIALDYINKLLEEFKTKKVEVTQGSPSIDLTDQIEKLGQLKEKGLITEEEFERKKIELLQRL